MSATAAVDGAQGTLAGPPRRGYGSGAAGAPAFNRNAAATGVAVLSACLAVTAALALGACRAGTSGSSEPMATEDGTCAAGTLNARGSSAQQHAMSFWRKAYQRKCAASTISYVPSGSGEGIQAFIDGTVDFAGSDSVLSEAEQSRADGRCRGGKAIHLPMAVGPVAIAYRLKGVDSLQLRPAILAKIFAGTITRWNDAAIRADNPNAKLPAIPIRAVHRSDSSGTTDNLTAFLTATARADWTFGKAREWKAPGGIAAKGSDGVASAVRGADGTLGYTELSFAQNASLKVAEIANGSGDFPELTPENAGRTVEDATLVGQGDDLKLEINYLTRKSAAYPLVLVTYEIVCAKGLAPDKVPLVRSFLSFAASSEGQRELGERGYAPLPDRLRPRVESAVQKIS